MSLATRTRCPSWRAVHEKRSTASWSIDQRLQPDLQALHGGVAVLVRALVGEDLTKASME